MSEPRIPPLPEADWTPEIAGTLDAAGAGGARLGDMNIFATLVRHWALFTRWQRFGGYLLQRGRLDPRDRELVILRTAYNCGSAYEWGHHVEIGARVGVPGGLLDRIAEGPAADGWSGREAALLRAADELHEGARIGDATWAALAADRSGDLDEQQLIELCMLVGQYHLVAFTLNSLGVQPEPGLEPLPD